MLLQQLSSESVSMPLPILYGAFAALGTVIATLSLYISKLHKWNVSASAKAVEAISGITQAINNNSSAIDKSTEMYSRQVLSQEKQTEQITKAVEDTGRTLNELHKHILLSTRQ